MNALNQVARMLGVRVDDADAAMKSERGYRAALSRRQLFAAGAALAVGSVLAGGALPILLHVYSDGCEWYTGETLEQAHGARSLWMGIDPDGDGDNHLELVPDGATISIWTDPEGIITLPDDDGASTMVLTAAEWARREGYGFLCTTEY